MRYAIIGMGAAGAAAAQAIRQCDPTGSVTIVTNDPHYYYSRPGLAYLLANEIPDRQLFPFPLQFFKDQRIRILLDSVDSIDLTRSRINLSSRQYVGYERLLIATGATAIQPDIPGIQLDGVVKLDNLTDAQHILKTASRSKTAVVVGGGITAIELVEGLVAQGVETYYFLRGDRYWSSVLDEVESRMVEKRLQKDGVKIQTFTELTEVLGRRGRVVGVQATSNGRTFILPCQMVAFAIGIRPRMRLGEAAGVQTRRGILVDPHLRTSAKNVFAAGDVAQVFDLAKGEYMLDSLWNPAIEMGRVAGTNMAGANLVYEKKVPLNVTRLAGLVTTIIGRVGKSEPRNGDRPKGDADVAGIMRGDSEVWRMLPDGVVAQTYEGENRLRLYIHENRLVGAVVMGDQTLSHPIQLMIQNEMDIQPIRSSLLDRNADLVSILNQFWSRQTHAAKIA